MSTPLIDINKLAEEEGFEVSRYGVKLIVVRQNDGATVMVNDELAQFARLLLAEVSKEVLKIDTDYRAQGGRKNCFKKRLDRMVLAAKIKRIIKEMC